MKPACGMDLLAPAAKEGVIDRDGDGRAGREEVGDDQLGQQQAHLVGLPAGGGEEAVCAAVVPGPGQVCSGEHPADGS